MQQKELAIKTFKDTFGENPTALALAPGRVEVLGNHTDYNEGFILSAAIDRNVIMVGRAISGDTARVYSGTFNTGDTFDINNLKLTKKNFWLNYVQGVVQILKDRGIEIGAFEAFVDGDIPLGAGLSSSAALEVATLMFLQQIYPFEMGAIEQALAAQESENKFVGVNCGILDQFSSRMGKQNHLVFLDCRDLNKYAHIPLGHGSALVIANSMAAHELADGTYNRLREECYAAAAFFAERKGDSVKHLRDVDRDDFNKYKNDLSDNLRNRASHVIGENRRVQECKDALQSGDLKKMGDLMLESHASSRDDFGNSCEELDTMVQCAIGIDGYYGSRLSGGGFGGATVNLVDLDKAEAFAKELGERYTSQTGIDAEIHVCVPSDGASACRL